MILPTLTLAMLTVFPLSQPEPPNEAKPREQNWITPSPGLRVDRDAGIVEFEATACLAPDPKGRMVDYLELFVCSWDSREHESLLATDIKPSQVHAALLLAGAKPGSPAKFQTNDRNELIRTPPTGTPVKVSFHWLKDEEHMTANPVEWVKHIETDERLTDAGFVFAGSQTSPDRGYLADREGTLISLVVFDINTPDATRKGVETVAWNDPISHEQAIDETVWIADPDMYPPRDTQVIVRLTVERQDQDSLPEIDPGESDTD